jgi:mannose-6-phosphate isomerase-like protein (cupin superfamily)
MPNNPAPFIVSLSSREGGSIVKSPKSISIRSGLVILRSGENVGAHDTGDHEELIVALDGRGEVEAEGLRDTTFDKGCVAYIPPHTRHNVFNRHTEPLRYIYIVAPAKMDKINS